MRLQLPLQPQGSRTPGRAGAHATATAGLRANHGVWASARATLQGLIKVTCCLPNVHAACSAVVWLIAVFITVV
jgi:hypothetical protein